MSKPGVLLLAAGKARRFGADKRLVPAYKHLSLLEVSLALYKNAGLDIRVCLSAADVDSPIFERLEDLQVESLVCERSELGMGFTIADAVQRFHPAGGVLIGLGDMPMIKRQTLDAVLSRVESSRIVFPSHQGRRGHPVYFSGDFYPELTTLSGDRGAALLFERFASRCVAVPVDDPGVLLDVDTRDQWRAALPMIYERFNPGLSN